MRVSDRKCFVKIPKSSGAYFLYYFKFYVDVIEIQFNKKSFMFVGFGMVLWFNFVSN